MEIVRHESLASDFKKLKRFPAPKESLEKWERLFDAKGLSEPPGIDQCPGFGDLKIYKARVVAIKENVGKSKSYRAIFELQGDCCRILVFSRHGIYHDEKDLIDLIKMRLD